MAMARLRPWSSYCVSSTHELALLAMVRFARMKMWFFKRCWESGSELKSLSQTICIKHWAYFFRSSVEFEPKINVLNQICWRCRFDINSNGMVVVPHFVVLFALLSAELQLCGGDVGGCDVGYIATIQDDNHWRAARRRHAGDRYRQPSSTSSCLCCVIVESKSFFLFFFKRRHSLNRKFDWLTLLEVYAVWWKPKPIEKQS